jgi:CheY-like chemotaxis protein
MSKQQQAYEEMEYETPEESLHSKTAVYVIAYFLFLAILIVPAMGMPGIVFAMIGAGLVLALLVLFGKFVKRKVATIGLSSLLRSGDMMVDVLSLEGYKPQVARNGREALEKVNENTSYLVFLDMLMPGMDGREVCLQLAAHPQRRQCHVIIIMSALDNLGEAAQLKADAIMPKPFAVEDILRTIEPFVE